MALIGFPVVQIITSSTNLPSSPSNGTLIYWGGTGGSFPNGMYVWTGSYWELLETTVST